MTVEWLNKERTRARLTKTFGFWWWKKILQAEVVEGVWNSREGWGWYFVGGKPLGDSLGYEMFNQVRARRAQNEQEARDSNWVEVKALPAARVVSE